ncbi:MAG TPA: glycoside hydrolase family 97 N-terminal domain-containing protein, partial [Prolixibacteraceae bacterium]|nr:glycoside hydrolase family 97 N-terminal domain-containing protein [Prolixibacteraceae bacterium]
MKFLYVLFLGILLCDLSFGQIVALKSPNNKIEAVLFNDDNSGLWYLKVNYQTENQKIEAIPEIRLGLTRSDQDFSKQLKFLKAGKQTFINEQYTAIHGKRSQCSNQANEVVLAFENPSKAKMNLIVRAYNDGLAFRYEFPEKEGDFTISNELTSYLIPDSTQRWLQKFDLSNEGLYKETNNANDKGDWTYPTLFKTNENTCWYLVHEADVDRTYCASKLSNHAQNNSYKVTLPYDHEGEGEALTKISLPWKSPWRVIIMGQLSDIVESTL